MTANYPLAPEQVVQALRREELIAYPTEAVFGLGCDPDSEKAVRALLALKQRSWRKGLILIAAEYMQIAPYVDDSQLSESAKQQVFSSWPGPVTWLMPARTHVPEWLKGEHTTLAVRVTAHPEVRQLCRLFGKPLVSTSANLSGAEPCRTWQEVRQQFGRDLVISGGRVGGRLSPSIIRDAHSGQLIRQG